MHLRGGRGGLESVDDKRVQVVPGVTGLRCGYARTVTKFVKPLRDVVAVWGLAPLSLSQSGMAAPRRLAQLYSQRPPLPRSTVTLPALPAFSFNLSLCLSRLVVPLDPYSPALTACCANHLPQLLYSSYTCTLAY